MLRFNPDNIDNILSSIRTKVSIRKKQLTAVELLPEDFEVMLFRNDISNEQIIKSSKTVCNSILNLSNRRLKNKIKKSTSLVVIPAEWTDVYYDSEFDYIGFTSGFISMIKFCVSKAVLELRYKNQIEIAKNKKSNLKTGELENKIKLGLRALHFNLVKAFLSPFNLPDISGGFSQTEKEKVNIISEPVLFFAILHELGHAHFHHEKISFDTPNKTYSEFAIPEEYNCDKEEEIAADLFAFKQVKPDYQSWLATGATIFFNMYLPYEIAFSEQSDTHPLSANRIDNILNRTDNINNETAKLLKGTIQNCKNFKSDIKTINSEPLKKRIDIVDFIINQATKNLKTEQNNA